MIHIDVNTLCFWNSIVVHVPALSSLFEYQIIFINNNKHLQLIKRVLYKHKM